jgi:uncharacterized protein YjbJ (UPF0337 family)
LNWDRIEGRWHDLDIIAGKRDQLVGLLQQRYGATRDDIEREVREFESRLADAP